MRPASSARHTHSLQQHRRRRRQLHVGRRLRPAAATALAKKQEPAETAAATPLRRGAGRAASRRTGAHLRAALPLRSARPAPRLPCALRGESGAERALGLPGGSAARRERCPQPALREPQGEAAAPAAAPQCPGGGRRRGAEESAGCAGVASPLCPLRWAAEGAGGGPGERRWPAPARGGAAAAGPSPEPPQGLPGPRSRGTRARGRGVRDTAAVPRGRNAERERRGSPGVSIRLCHDCALAHTFISLSCYSGILLNNSQKFRIQPRLVIPYLSSAQVPITPNYLFLGKLT
ncbi:collagen alpha-2(I) chain-like isoform X2 [Prinia subflava]|uniref:collagen alpha-2(I) chain-like isoform X2 n=2 Tax=Prinia subflava TaxID=208062 RepID=UPI002FE244EF